MTSEGNVVSGGGAAGAERRRLEEDDNGAGWRRWGPYVSARQWGTVREDYSKDGEAWFYLPHDHARSRAYRWGEDGIAGVCDDQQTLCLAVALWNGRDPIVKERLFGLSGPEGNHGEDVKEYWFHRDSTPTHSSMSFLYKYPQREFPYLDLVTTNARRSRTEFEYELLDTGVFDEGRYFDVEVEYAKAAPEDLVMRVTVHNRGPDDAPVHLLPTLWFRNTWSWADAEDHARPGLRAAPGQPGLSVVDVEHPVLGRRRLLCAGRPPLLFTENETNTERLFGTPNATPYVKDGVGRFVVDGETDAVNPAHVGTKAAAHYLLDVPAGGSTVVRLRLTDREVVSAGFDADVDAVIAQRRAEADEFYAGVISPGLGEGEREVVRRALAGLLWSKQFYAYDVEQWQREHDTDPRGLRNAEWVHLRAGDVISMPDTWEYPWFAAWDLAFHCVPLAMVDLTFAKQQLELLLTRRYQHPNGQIPAYEWNFSDVNPPVHGWASYFVYQFQKSRTGKGDVRWLENQYHKLAKNFAWWVNRKDPDGRNVFQGGFLGLDNIGVFDRSAPLPTGGTLDQADGTAWMALYCQTMLQIALELAEHDDVYVEQAAGYLEHFGWIAIAVGRGVGGTSMWDEDDGFFYDLLRLPDGSSTRLAVRSMVGLLPLAATTLIDPETAATFPELIQVGREFVERHVDGPSLQAAAARHATGRGGYLLGIFDEGRIRRILARMLDEQEFLGPYGIRSLSKAHQAQPYEFWVGGQAYRVAYAPAESDTGMFGGNSNWRGPVWFPVNALLIRALLNIYAFYGDGFRIECPTGSGRELTLFEVAREISDRLTRTFLRGADGRRPVYGGERVFQEDPHWRDLLLFHEYFHGDNGAGLGATHQTGWTGLAAVFPQLFAVLSPEDVALRGLWAQPRRGAPGGRS
ncbi:MAG TPA: glucosidase [Kineosporiaceae bacterium]|nr:glucosidase [Kineosporiaceae bacterium]